MSFHQRKLFRVKLFIYCKSFTSSGRAEGETFRLSASTETGKGKLYHREIIERLMFHRQVGLTKGLQGDLESCLSTLSSSRIAPAMGVVSLKCFFVENRHSSLTTNGLKSMLGKKVSVHLWSQPQGLSTKPPLVHVVMMCMPSKIQRGNRKQP